MVIDVSQRPDHGQGRLGQAADGLLTDLDLAEPWPLLGFLYNLMADSPGPPAYAPAPTDPEMWDSAPSASDALDLLARVTRFGAIRTPPGSKPAPLAMFRVEPDPRYRLNGLALAYRAWSVDSTTAAGQAVLANLTDGYYQQGDVATSPERRDLFVVNAVDRDGICLGLTRPASGGAVEDLASAWQVKPGRAIEVGGAIVTGLASLLTALQERPALRR
ncbi:hypothetical protein I6A60_06245 [Frankia sp. AgB1.9]|uniref:hypothetical protein n=1 Tax=unclassified Frankia TaxID=2632575 RepID=UPI001931A7C7|nr:MULTISPECIES: hypothetical protein [unclassified Frankia]MBL7487515.1 hypothetical protein [Frankia sp. AgW1.1]MBL7547478.1 hypothetical protein [Frankia sp. AgB1.9]MBL7618747.1 hypothetical protein [Frankia sp. AgB1.8]